MASKAKKGKSVRISYVGKLDDGTVVDTTQSQGNITVTVGAGEIVPGLDKALIGMKPGESKSLKLEPSQAYGFRSMEHVYEVDPAQIPVPFEIQVGQKFKVKQVDGSVREVVVLETGPGFALIDGNHPLASESIHYELTLIDVL